MTHLLTGTIVYHSELASAAFPKKLMNFDDYIHIEILFGQAEQPPFLIYKNKKIRTLINL